MTIYAVGEYVELVSHPIKITEFNDPGSTSNTNEQDVIRTDTGGQNNDGTHIDMGPLDTTIDKYQYQCENHAPRGTIYVSDPEPEPELSLLV